MRGAAASAAATRLSALILLPALLAPAPSPGALRLREAGAEWGIDFRHHHGGSGRRYMVETVVGGVVLFDFDGDGDEDIFLVDGGRLPGYEGEEPRSRLFRNDGDRRFLDWTGESGIRVAAYGSGAVAGDPDGDGDLDLYVTALGPNQLFRNEGDGSFLDVSAEAGVDDPLWGASAAFADPDRDGDLDLYVANYVDFTVEGHRPCKTQTVETYCYPGAYDGQPDRFYRNRGDGSFSEEAAAVGLEPAEYRAGLGVVFGDLNGDDWPDLYVANDAEANFLFLNRGDGTFEDVSLLSGAAYGDTGRPEAGMGVALGDVDGDGDSDIVVTNFELETNALYRNTGAALFVDSRFASNIAEPSLLTLAFGVALADLDHDRDLDLIVANGHIMDNASELHFSSRYAQPNQVLENLGNGRFREVAQAGLELERVSRGLALGDLDRDGDLDAVFNNSNDLAEVYENLSGVSGGWLQVDLAGRGGNRFGVDARVEVRSGEGSQYREVHTGSSFLSQHAITLHFGLGEAKGVEEMAVRWPTGRRQLFRDLPTGRRLRVFE